MHLSSEQTGGRLFLWIRPVVQNKNKQSAKNHYTLVWQGYVFCVQTLLLCGGLSKVVRVQGGDVGHMLSKQNTAFIKFTLMVLLTLKALLFMILSVT